ncbi:MAG: DoxX family membrane protein, partial [Candidatus Marinimicrobia bacterium]|nr:DoxX family membrane protein [Candidatus Neomarinimicrobiota bacterium]
MDKLNSFSGYGHWLVRLSLAGTFLFHGMGKFPMAEMMAKMMDMPLPMIYMLAMMEVAAGALILYGGIGPDWATRVAGLIIAAVMISAVGM